MRKIMGVCIAGVVLIAGCGGGGGGSDGVNASPEPQAAGPQVADTAGGGTGSGSGSGSSTLALNASWASQAMLLHSTVLTPELSGFQGHAPRCSIASGALPPGMKMGNDCVLQGRPTKSGTYNYSVRVGADGASGTVDLPMWLQVIGPGLFYEIRREDKLVAGMQVRDAPSFGIWTVPQDAGVTWSFQITGGSLPPGLALDAATGVVSGTITSAGHYLADLRATLHSSFGDEGPIEGAYAQEPGTTTFGYAPNSTSPLEYVVYTGIPTSLEPQLRVAAPGATLSNFALAPNHFLPQGLALDPVSGRISGVLAEPARLGRISDIAVTATVTSGGVVTTTGANLTLHLFEPADVAFDPPTANATVGSTPIDVSPRITSKVEGFQPAVSYKIDSFGCGLPPGVTVNLATGRVSGTPTATGSWICHLDAILSNAGVSWLVPIELDVGVGR